VSTKRDLMLFLAGCMIVAVLGAVRLDAVPLTAAPSCQGQAHAMARLELLFGTARPTGDAITEEQWTAFLDAEVTPRFPAGLTVLEGTGQWRGRTGVDRERSNVLIIWYEPTARADQQIEAIRTAYKRRFDQESVLRVDSVSCVSF
jgi:Protein of unknown function (DUF3574)